MKLGDIAVYNNPITQEDFLVKISKVFGSWYEISDLNGQYLGFVGKTHLRLSTFKDKCKGVLNNESIT